MLGVGHVNIRIEVVMTQERILGGESGDELVACVSHAVSMAENRGKVKRWWTERKLVGFVLGLQLAHLSIDHVLSMAHVRRVWGRWWTPIALACSTHELLRH